jgi:GDP-4-dehydro-6-deoxy-D-mannose reductase
LSTAGPNSAAPFGGAAGCVLVTGASGFVGLHLVNHLLAAGDRPVAGAIRPGTGRPELSAKIPTVELDLTGAEATRRVIEQFQPAAVYHLAAQASVGESHADPLGTFFNNVGSQINLFEALLACGLRPRMLVVGSNEEYGLVNADELPVCETNELRPLSPYAVSKVAQDLLGYQYYVAHDLPIVRVRPFTHTGPGQEARFVTADFARQIARIEAGLQPAVIRVGNLDARRDLTDVRDVVRAYRLLLLHGEAGAVYNVGSGQAVSIQALLDGLLALSRVPVRVELDPDKLRPSEAPPQFADCQKLHVRTGWRPEIPLQQTLADVLDDWRDRVARYGRDC